MIASHYFLLFVGLLVLPIASQKAQQTQTAQDAAKHEAGLVLALSHIKVDAIAEDGQIDDDARDVADSAACLVRLLQQSVVNQKGDDDQCGIDEVVGGFFGNHLCQFEVCSLQLFS